MADSKVAAVRGGVDDVVEQKDSAQQAESTASVGRANHGTAGTATCGSRVEGGVTARQET